MKIAVTGATGHIGVNTVRLLAEAGHELHLLMHSSENSGLEEIPAKWFQGDVRRQEDMEALCQGVEAVIHLAALISMVSNREPHIWDINVGGVENVIAAARKQGVRRLIYISSIHAFRNEGQPVLDETANFSNAKDPAYDQTKATATQLVRKAAGPDLETIVLHPTAVVGPGDYKTSLTGQLFRDMAQGRLPAMVVGGYDWVDVRDVARAIQTALEQGGNDGQSYLLAGGFTPVTELGQLVQEVTGTRPPRLVSPVWLAKIGVPFAELQAKLTGGRPLFTYETLRTIEMAHRNVSIEKARQELGFNPRPLAESVRDFFAWAEEEGRW